MLTDARVFVSACLLGEAVRYNATAATCDSPVLHRWRREGIVVALCPEVAAGYPVPRPACEIVGGDGDLVLAGRAVVVDVDGQDETAEFIAGAQAALAAAQSGEARVAILKDGSPSCGCHWVYDGTFSGHPVPGRGVTAALLEQHGIRTFSEQQVDLAAEFLDALGSV